MRRILAEIQSGAFAKEWMGENEAGRANFNRMRAEEANHEIEVVGKRLREMMAFLSKPSHTAPPAAAAAPKVRKGQKK